MLLQIIGIAITGAIISLLIKQQRPEFAILTSITTGIVLIFFALSAISDIIGVLENIFEKVSIDYKFIIIVIKIIGIAYACQFAQDICTDAGEKAIGTYISLAGKALIIIQAMPIMLSLLNLIIGILQ